MDNIYQNRAMTLIRPAVVTRVFKGLILLSLTSIISTPIVYYAIIPSNGKSPALIEHRTAVDKSYPGILHDPKVPVGIKAIKSIIPPILYCPSIKFIIDIILYFIITAQGLNFFVRIFSPKLINAKILEPDRTAMKQMVIKAHKKALKHRANELRNVKSFLNTYRAWFEIHRKHCDKLDEDDPKMYLFTNTSELPDFPLDSGRLEDIHEHLMREDMRRAKVQIRCQKEKINYLTICLKSLNTGLEDFGSSDKENIENLQEGNVSLKLELEELRAKMKEYIQHMKEWSSHSSDEEFDDEICAPATNVNDFSLD